MVPSSYQLLTSEWRGKCSQISQIRGGVQNLGRVTFPTMCLIAFACEVERLCIAICRHWRDAIEGLSECTGRGVGDAFH